MVDPASEEDGWELNLWLLRHSHRARRGSTSLGRGTRVARRHLAKFYFCRVLRKRDSIHVGTVGTRANAVGATRGLRARSAISACAFQRFTRVSRKAEGFLEKPWFLGTLTASECAQKPPPKTGFLGKLSGLLGNEFDRFAGSEEARSTLIGFLGNAGSTSVTSTSCVLLPSRHGQKACVEIEKEESSSTGSRDRRVTESPHHP